MDDRFRRVIRHFSQPGFMEEIHVAVEDIAAEGRVGEYVIDRFGLQVRQTVS